MEALEYGLLVDGEQVVVSFGQSLLEAFHDGFYRKQSAHFQERAEQHHVVGLA